MLTNLLEDIRQHVGCLFQLSADVAELDLILSLAQISSNPEYVRPSFGTKLELVNSFHPIMELFNRDLPVANDVVSEMSDPRDKFTIFSHFIPWHAERHDSVQFSFNNWTKHERQVHVPKTNRSTSNHGAGNSFVFRLIGCTYRITNIYFYITCKLDLFFLNKKEIILL